MEKLQGNQHIKGKDIAKYVFLPGIVPRIKEFTDTGFGWVACLMASIYATVRLLPAGHPYLRPENNGKFGIRNVIAEAAKNLRFKKENIDQILVFFALLTGFVVLIMQFVTLLVMILIKPVFAGMFDTPSPTNDIAFLLLDYVLGVPGFFCNTAGTCTSIQATLPTPVHSALHSLFQFYSLAILVIAVLVFLYYLFVLVGETAQTGTPFGRRFSHIWAPIRLVVALGLLVPINHGLNSAQYITLMSARMGSGLATNGWALFNNTLTDANAPLSTNNNSALIAEPNAPDLTPLVNFLLLVSACKYAYEFMYWESGGPTIHIWPYLISAPYNSVQVSAAAYTYDSALTFYNNDDVIIRFGDYKPARTAKPYIKEKGYVRNFCGEVRIPTSTAFHYRAAGGNMAGALQIQEHYFDLVRKILNDGRVQKFGKRAACIGLKNLEDKTNLTPALANECNFTFATGETDQDHLPSAAFLVDLMETGTADGPVLPEATNGINTALREEVIDARQTMLDEMEASGDIAIQNDVLDRGWGGAGMWYNHIAEWNGIFVTSLINYPTPQSMPEIMDAVRKERQKHDENVDALKMFVPVLSDQSEINFDSMSPAGQGVIAKLLSVTYMHLKEGDASLDNDERTQGNIFFDAITSMLGIQGLFNMRSEKSTHPLAQLSALGKSMIESSIRNLMTSLLFSAGGGMAQAINQHFGAGINAIGSIFSSMATIGLTVGFILYYILPFMPFMYFFFAVGGWVKGIFEAMVGVPLWALAHLRIDGEGLPSQTASNGYYLILEIFLRPILTVFGLIASIAIFSALARVLNEIFPLLTENLSGFASSDPDPTAGLTAENAPYKRGVIDEFFFTVIYAILVYLMATASFKLIDMIPNNILRWIGAGVQSFGDQSGDPTEGLVQYAAIGGANMAQEAVGAAQGVASLGGQGAGYGLSALSKLGMRDANFLGK